MFRRLIHTCRHGIAHDPEDAFLPRDHRDVRADGSRHFLVHEYVLNLLSSRHAGYRDAVARTSGTHDQPVVDLAGADRNLKGIPAVVIAAEASYHRNYDHCTVKYLNQAGMKVEWLPLDKAGIHGNGHMMMIEKNNLQIAKVIDDWVRKNVK